MKTGPIKGGPLKRDFMRIASPARALLRYWPKKTQKPNVDAFSDGLTNDR
jgi:hypothetical protein